MRISIKVVLGMLLLAVVASPFVAAKSSATKQEVKKIVLKKDNVIVLNDVIDSKSVPEIIQKARALDQDKGLNRLVSNKDPIYVFVRSPGGEIQTGLEMLEALKGLNRPVDTVTMFGASMAFQTVQQLGKRYIVKNGILMSHRAAGEFSGSFGGQKPSQMDSRKGLWESRLDEMDARTVERSGGKQTMESYQKAYSSELWVTGSQAVDQGYADAVVNVQCDESLSGVTTKTVNLMGLVNISYDLDDCPLNSSPMNIRLADLPTNKGTMTFTDFSAKGGEFGVNCLVAAATDANKVCAADASLTMEKILTVKNQFKSDYDNIQNRIVPYGK